MDRPAYHRAVDPTLVVGIAGLIGALTGAAAVLAFRVSERTQLRLDPPRQRGARMSRTAPRRRRRRARGAAAMVSSPRLGRRHRAVEPVRRSVRSRSWRSARRVGTHHAGSRRASQRRDPARPTSTFPRGPLGGGTIAVSARVAPLSGGLVLVLVEDRSKARRVDAMRRDFVANVSHELKTPVGALVLLAEAMQEAPQDPEAVQTICRPHAAGVAALVGADPGPHRLVSVGSDGSAPPRRLASASTGSSTTAIGPVALGGAAAIDHARRGR